MMEEELEYSFAKFKDTFSKLKEGALQCKDKLDRDGVIYRFKLTFETMWKALKIFLGYKGIECKAPKSCLKEAFRIGLVENENIFLDMLEDRNRTSHMYNEGVYEEIFERIEEEYIPEMEKVLKKLWEE